MNKEWRAYSREITYNTYQEKELYTNEQRVEMDNYI
jgi:hypothetical protein